MNRSALRTSVAAVVAALVAGGLVYLVMHQSLARVGTENERLRAQLADGTKERTILRLEPDIEKERREKDQTDLLRLRGEVGVLRKQKDEVEKLRKVNEELTAALTKVAQPPSEAPDPEADPERRVAIAHLNDAKQLVLGLLLFAEDHQQALPATLNQTSNYWGGASRLLTNQFELVLQKPFREVENPSAIIAVRQREAWQSKGNWVKVYGFADGHAELKKEPPEGFEAWEQLHLAPR